MNLMGFNFSRISVEKTNKKSEDMKISANVKLEDIKEVKANSLKTKESILGVLFSYTVKYGEVANIDLAGSIVLSIDQKLSKKVLKEWKEKKIADEFRIPVLNLVLAKSNVKALQLEEEMNLPYHLPMPRVSADKPSEEKSKK
jgi:hypothetical protein